ncbi:MAG: hypothetical protein R3E31_18820 [Chloroflexota bacterium]|nr:hypothetical protein [Anaerolineales bacterium]MCB8966186.1 hypothetical protein [Ardenticatenaceae bacterium]
MTIPKRPGPDTQFYIDYEWWDSSSLDLKTYLYTRLSHIGEINIDPGIEEVDLVDAKTAEVRRVDGFQYMVQVYFSQLPEDFMASASLVDAVFCVLLANGNQPMTAREIAERVRRSSDVIVRTFSGPRVYQGIRPLLDE